MNRRWIALYSQSGSELHAIIEALGREPDAIYSDRHSETRHEQMQELTTVASHKEITELLAKEDADTVITLHGYLRILEGDSNLFNHTILNSHPGDIVSHPELKGLHPQRKALELGLDSTGVVIHKVIPEVDEGPIIARSMRYLTKHTTIEDLISKLRDDSIRLWLWLLGEEGAYWNCGCPISRQDDAA